MIKKLSKLVLLMSAFIGIIILFQQQVVFANTTEGSQESNQENLVPDAEIARQINEWGTAHESQNWPKYPEITQEKFDIFNNAEGSNSFILILNNVPTKSLEGLQYLNPKFDVLILISGTEITDLTPLTKIDNLVQLALTMSESTQMDLTVIKQLTKLQVLAITGSTNFELDMVANMPDLNYFSLQGLNKRVKITPPTVALNLPNLETCTIFYADEMSDFSFISTYMRNLKQLLLVSVPITNIDSMVQLSKLEKLVLIDTFIGSYPAELTDLIQKGNGEENIYNENNWYDEPLQNKLAPIEAKAMMKNESLQVDVSLHIQNTSPLIAAMNQLGMELLTSSDLFQAEITSSNPEIVSVNPASTVQQISLDSHNRAGTAVITYKLPSNKKVSFEVTVHGDGIAPIVQGENVVYEQGSSKTEAAYLQDAKIVLDKAGTITTDFDQVVNLDQVGTYTVTVYGTDEDGVQSATIQLVVTIQAKKEEPSKTKPTQPGSSNPREVSQSNEDIEQPKAKKNDEKHLPKTASQDNPAIFYLGSLLVLVSALMIGKNRFLLK